MLAFVNRDREILELNKLSQKGGLLVLFGRRRIGKTRLLSLWVKEKKGLYSQAIEAHKDIQLDQIFNDIKDQLSTSIVPKSWQELFEIIELQKGKIIFCMDEFPYLVASDASLPSVLQKWLDHKKKQDIFIILSGSSSRMMHDITLKLSAPLYGRALKIIQVEPLSYADLCKTCNLNPSTIDSFRKYSLLGGVPKYWEFVEKNKDSVDLADNLYFDFAAYMESEPKRILSDENILGTNPVSLLEVVGRGAEKPSEMAARLGTVQTNISRLLQQLLDASILTRHVPFGHNLKAPKKTLYRIKDPSIRFWFKIFSPHRTLWRRYTHKEKLHLISLHASTVFEDFWMSLHPGAMKYWEKNLEFDFVYQPERKTGSCDIVVVEVKWKKLSSREKKKILYGMKERWQQSQLSKKYFNPEFKIIDSTNLSTKP